MFISVSNVKEYDSSYYLALSLRRREKLLAQMSGSRQSLLSSLRLRPFGFFGGVVSFHRKPNSLMFFFLFFSIFHSLLVIRFFNFLHSEIELKIIFNHF